MGSSRTRARTRVPCIGRRILNHCATKEAPLRNFLKSQNSSRFFTNFCKIKKWNICISKIRHQFWTSLRRRNQIPLRARDRESPKLWDGRTSATEKQPGGSGCAPWIGNINMYFIFNILSLTGFATVAVCLITCFSLLLKNYNYLRVKLFNFRIESFTHSPVPLGYVTLFLFQHSENFWKP